ncbi:hypothetical protein FHL15_009628 [Xylaria flabelliformis]|uniref:Protein kinase domain-containing protein n=1 Tax=Xylaria flabelliformis TaxID=2512241 RepID=A0A553HNE0_9PEZI|nr:hypothetical protein FHL15_009628 [Xylaria flabelliformis]
MAKTRGICYWVGTILQAVRRYFDRQPQSPEVASTVESQGKELKSNEERGHPEITGDSTVRQVTTVPSDVDSSMLNETRNRIAEKLGESNTNNAEQFLIRSSLKLILDIETVKHILNEVGLGGNGDQVQTLAEFIIDRALPVFAILIKMSKPCLIKSFHVHDFEENMLPIKYEGKRSEWSVKSYFNTASDVTLQKIFTQDKWIYADVAEFCDTNQWHFFPLVFTKERFRYIIPSDMRLPYTPAAKELKTAGTNYSLVEKRSIYSECFESSIQGVSDDDEDICVAVKRLIQSNEEEAEKEATALENIRKSPNVHLIKAIAYIRTEPTRRYSFVFPWAQHGNLWDFWFRHEGVPRNREYFIKVFRQLRCLACAITELSDKHLRHGDLKPENIVCFKTDNGLPDSEEKNSDDIRLVIIDVGLAKIHDKNTQLRAKTDTKVSTRRYAAPELETRPGKELSRRFDVWSMGCIFFEFAIWLIYGKQKLLEFTTGNGPEEFKFFETKSNLLDSGEGQKKIAKRHSSVNDLIYEMQENPCCSNGTAIRRLIDLISNKMLAVDLSDDKEPKPGTESQSTCNCVQDAHSILSRSAENASDVELGNTSTGDLSTQPPLPEINISKAPTIKIGISNSHSAENDSISKPRRPYARVIKEELESILDDLENERIDAIKSDVKATKPAEKPAEASGLLNIAHRHLLNDEWDYAPDDAIARDLFNSFDASTFSPQLNIPSTLCGRCRGLRLWSQTCSFSDSPAGLEDKANSEGYNRKQIVANLCTPLLSQSTSLHDVQIGFPELPAAAGDTHLKILKKWITDCDRNHGCYPKSDTFIPTRLLDIRNQGSGTIQLLDNNRARSRFGHYATLSHRWGSLQQHKFCTFKSNIEELKQGIKIASLPRTFQDAVRIAYGLGLRYLWIDSLCIIQDDPLDWETESKHMEHVFSSAYCTLAASCSFGSGDGFLKPRPMRLSVMMQGLQDSDAAYFVCETIDDFIRDVEQSELNQRGWVLQERALSRRTIYFTERQSYWECGEGVRCETMTRMKNRKASFLGDPNFPRSVDQFAKGLRIEIFEDLYERYSRLALSYPSDRPIAIRGLESRLINTFGTSGGVGIFDTYLHRSLLWQRAGDTLKSITSFRDASVPSWSWMAYDGPICYLTVPFGEVTWCENIISPFSKGGSRRSDKVIAPSPLELEAPVWNLIDAEGGQRILDDPSRALDWPIQCVILGKSKMPLVDESQIHWVLLVHLKEIANNIAIYERVGVGVLRKRHIAFDRPQERRRIQ